MCTAVMFFVWDLRGPASCPSQYSHIYILTCISVCIYSFMCVLFTSTKKTKVSKPVRWTNQVLQHSWDSALEKTRERKKTTKSTLVQVTYYTLNFTVSFMRWPNDFIRATIGAVVFFFWTCSADIPSHL